MYYLISISHEYNAIRKLNIKYKEGGFSYFPWIGKASMYWKLLEISMRR